jgi:hypothetical protein
MPTNQPMSVMVSIPDNKEVIFSLDDFDTLENIVKNKSRRPDDYWANAQRFVKEYISGKYKHNLTDKQFNWLTKIKIDIERVQKGHPLR